MQDLFGQEIEIKERQPRRKVSRDETKLQERIAALEHENELLRAARFFQEQGFNWDTARLQAENVRLREYLAQLEATYDEQLGRIKDERPEWQLIDLQKAQLEGKEQDIQRLAGKVKSLEKLIAELEEQIDSLEVQIEMLCEQNGKLQSLLPSKPLKPLDLKGVETPAAIATLESQIAAKEEIIQKLNSHLQHAHLVIKEREERIDTLLKSPELRSHVDNSALRQSHETLKSIVAKQMGGQKYADQLIEQAQRIVELEKQLAERNSQ